MSDNRVNYGKYYTVAASQTDAAISPGIAGDYLEGVLVIPATVGGGVVTIKDGSTTVVAYPGATVSALVDLKPFWISIKARCVNAGWKVTTGANVSVLASAT